MSLLIINIVCFTERVLRDDDRPLEILQEWGPHQDQVKLILRYTVLPSAMNGKCWVHSVWNCFVCFVYSSREEISLWNCRESICLYLNITILCPRASSFNVILSGRKFALSNCLIRVERRHALIHLRETERWELTSITFSDSVRTAQKGYGRQAMYVWRSIEERSCGHFVVEKNLVLHIVSVCL